MTEPLPGATEPTAGDTAAVRRAYLHVGAPKTGTTYLQGVLWRNRRVLQQAGAHVLGRGRGDHYQAGKDLMDMPFDPADPGVDWTGAWDILAAAAAASPAEVVLISDEHLASLSPDQVRRAAAGLAPREVHVVYATRNLKGLMPSEWQEYVKHGSTLDFDTWSNKILTTSRRGPGRWFWSVHDPVDVIRRWSTAVPAANIHVITMPPPSAGPNELWHRFAGVVGIDPQLATDFDVAGNTSLGLAEAEVLRRVNLALPEDFPRWYRTGLTRDVLAAKVLGARPSSDRPQLSEALDQALVKRAERSIKGLKASGCDVVGDLADLRVVPDAGPPTAAPSTQVLLDTSVDAIAGLLVHMAWMRDERRRSESRLRQAMHKAPMMRRIRGRVASWEDRNRAVAMTLSRYRRVRAGLRHDG